MRLVQMNYSCLPNADGTLKGAATPSNTVGMDVDFDPASPHYERLMAEAPQTILAKKDELLADYAVKSERVHTILQLLKAYTMFRINEEYVVMDGQVKIVDEQTGRIMEGRRRSLSLIHN